jgi:hypothetical protein
MYTHPLKVKALRFYFWTISSGKRDKGIFMYSNRDSDVHDHHGGVLCGEGAVDYDFECCDFGSLIGDVAGVVESVTAPCQ